VKIDVLREIVSATLKVTVGSCTIQYDEYDVDENGGEDDASGIDGIRSRR